MGQATRWVLPDACPCVKNLYILYIYILSLPLISWWFRTKQITAIWLAGPPLSKSNGISKSNEKRTGFEIAGRVYRCRGSWLKAEAGWRTPAGRANSMARDLPSPCRCGASWGWTEGTPVLADMPSRCGACCRRIAYACKYDRLWIRLSIGWFYGRQEVRWHTTGVSVWHHYDVNGGVTTYPLNAQARTTCPG